MEEEAGEGERREGLQEVEGCQGREVAASGLYRMICISIAINLLVADKTLRMMWMTISETVNSIINGTTALGKYSNHSNPLTFWIIISIVLFRGE